ncbi:unnamed protein product [Didymodactylos carnosus]|uniref:ubiquitinyl hydrolase 1 n=1 Tax=Didymodactylos carnosus TaxID=1234261 RepID=A0A8S2IGG5_9BILA|nr:unnamed protein product [Didymodactylos carnosus]CAF3749447.1 unnamed protein product [Didymodactylos carnosus]
MGNSCYMNSALQCLSNIPQLTSYFLLQNSNSTLSTNTNSQVVSAYVSLMSKIWSRDHQPFEPTELKQIIINLAPQFFGPTQQDTHEFMIYLLHALHDDLKTKTLNGTDISFISDLFQGKIETTVQCLTCENCNSTITEFLFITLPLEQQERYFVIEYISAEEENKTLCISTQASGLISDLINEFIKTYNNIFSPKISEANIQPQDLHNKTYETKSQLSDIQGHKIRLKKVPRSPQIYDAEGPVLTRLIGPLTLKDCIKEYLTLETLDEHGQNYHCQACAMITNSTMKINLNTLPDILILQLKRFYFDSNLQQKKNDTFVDCPISSLDLRNYVATDVEQKYNLIAVSNHTGTIQSGHYTTNALNSIDKCWYQFDDESVTKIDEKSVITKEAYLLIYARQNGTLV